MSDADHTGRGQMVRNVVTSWLSQLVFIVFGFVMPRMIDESIGQTALGVWDFGWAIVHYLSLTMLGIGSSVNRFVARYRATADWHSMSSSMSSVIAIQTCIGFGVFLCVTAVSAFVPTILDSQLGAYAGVAGDVVFYLGAALAVQMAFNAFRGMLTGYHQWTTHNALNAIGYTVSAVGMLIVLSNGGGLKGMVIVYFVVTILTELIRLVVVRALCPEIQLRWNMINRSDIQKMVRFGMKSMGIYLPIMIIRQTVNFFIVTLLGPAMLAVIARPMSLVMHINTIVNKFALVLTPTAGALQVGGRHGELREFSLVTMRAGWIFAVLPTVFLLVLGDRVIDLWMGPGYADWAVIAILAGGAILPLSQRALVTIMVGMNKHGRIAKYSVVVSTLVAVIGFFIVFQVGWTLSSAAWLIVLPANIGTGLIPMIIGCRTLNVSVAEYFRIVLRDPLFLLMLTGASLMIVRFFGPQATLSSLLTGFLVTGILSAFLLKDDIRKATFMLTRPDAARQEFDRKIIDTQQFQQDDY